MTQNLKRQTRRVRNDTPWPAHWEVSFTYTHGKTVLESRKHEVALKGHPNVWYVFDRHVINPAIGKEWIDALALKPFGAFTAFRPEMIVKVRARRIAKESAKKANESVVSDNAEVKAADDEQPIAA